jgi:hypothetical protein
MLESIKKRKLNKTRKFFQFKNNSTKMHHPNGNNNSSKQDDSRIKPKSLFYPTQVFPESKIAFTSEEVSSSQSVAHNYVAPLLSVFYWILLFPHKIVYNQELNQSVKKKGSLLRRVYKINRIHF